jgi:diguanylate cyclase (GGDEF)-like protein
MEMWTFGLPTPVTLATIAAIGYLFGRQHRGAQPARRDVRRELQRAEAVVHELEFAAQDVRRSLAAHHSSVQRFKEQVTALSKQNDEAAWKQLSAEAEKILRPTLLLSKEIARAYDAFRQQTATLASLTETRVDSVTGLNNRRALDETLHHMFAMMARYQTVFSLAIFSLDRKQGGGEEGVCGAADPVLRRLARTVEQCVRETDIVARFGDEEFAAVMPETDLTEACLLGERIRRAVASELALTLSGGAATALDGDSPQTLLARADSALYSAKLSGGDALFRHTGRGIEAAVGPFGSEVPDGRAPPPPDDALGAQATPMPQAG